MEIIKSILSNPIYVLLFGGGGILVIVTAVIAIIAQKKKTKNHNRISVKKSKRTSITENHLKDGKIDVTDSESTVVRNNRT